jgi:hypothetical protein
MFDIHEINHTSINSNAHTHGKSLPLLRRNVKRRFQKLAHSSAKHETLSISKAAGTKLEPAIANFATLKKTPFLKRNLCIPNVSSVSSRLKTLVGAKRDKVVADDMNTRCQYRVHCIKYENNEKIPKVTVMASFLYPEYQCPFCISYEGVSKMEKMQYTYIDTLSDMNICICCHPG